MDWREGGDWSPIINFRKALKADRLGLHSLPSRFPVSGWDPEQVRLCGWSLRISDVEPHPPPAGARRPRHSCLQSPAKAKSSLQASPCVVAAAAMTRRSDFILIFYFVISAPVHNFKDILKQIVGWAKKKRGGDKWIRIKCETLQRFLKLPTRPENNSLRQFKGNDSMKETYWRDREIQNKMCSFPLLSRDDI